MKKYILPISSIKVMFFFCRPEQKNFNLTFPQTNKISGMSDLSTKFSGKSEAEKNQRRVRCAAAEGLLVSTFSPRISLAVVRCLFVGGQYETHRNWRETNNGTQRTRGSETKKRKRKGRERETAGRKRQLGRGGTEHTRATEERKPKRERYARLFVCAWIQNGMVDVWRRDRGASKG